MVLVAWLGLVGCSSDQSVPAGDSVQSGAETTNEHSIHAITHATVIDPASGSNEYRDMTIVIRGDRIISGRWVTRRSENAFEIRG
jgi:hypothetical protein